MRINAQETVLLNKRNLNVLKNTPETTTIEQPTKSPVAMMNALQAQGINNITFQGINIGKTMKAAVPAIMLSVAALSSQSCEKFFRPSDVIVNVDFDLTHNNYFIKNYYNDISHLDSLWNAMLEQGKITNEQLEDIKAQNDTLRNDVNKGQAEQQEAYKALFETQYLILEQVILSNNYSAEILEELYGIKQGIDDAIKANQNPGYKEAIDQIKDLLEKITGKLDDILDTLKALREDFNNFCAKYDSDKASANEILKLIYENGKINNQLLNIYGEYVVAMNNSVKLIKENSDKILESINNNHAELIEKLSDLSAEERKFFEEMFKTYGLTIDQVISMSAEELKATIQAFMENFEKTEGKQTEIMLAIKDAIANVAERLNNIQSPIDYSDDFATIINLIKANPNLTEEQVRKLLEEFACNCECGGSNEGIIEDLENLLK